MKYTTFLQHFAVALTVLLAPTFCFAMDDGDPVLEALRITESTPNSDPFLKSIKKEKESVRGVDGIEEGTKEFKTHRRNNFREQLNKLTCFDGKEYQQKGDIYSQCGGHFRTVKTLTKTEIDELSNSYMYAISSFSVQLEALSGLSRMEILAMNAYGLNYLLNLYFDVVITPREGDLVVYRGEEYPHAGICRQREQGLVTESWWRYWSNPMVFEHDLFFLPERFGNIAKFYRLKTTLPKDAFDDLEAGPLLAKPREDGIFVFERTEGNAGIREFVTSAKMSEIEQKYPRLFKVRSSIKFFGVCYGYAIGKVFGTYQEPSVVPYFECNPVETQTFFDKYFEVTAEPQKGDFVIYYQEDPVKSPYSQYSWKHFGVYMGKNLVDSKWGAGPVAYHPVFFADNLDGDYVKFLRMKRPPQEILKELEEERKRA